MNVLAGFVYTNSAVYYWLLLLAVWLSKVPNSLLPWVVARAQGIFAKSRNLSPLFVFSVSGFVSRDLF